MHSRTKKFAIGFLLLMGFASVASQKAPNGFRFRIAIENERLIVSECQPAPGFTDYLNGLNKILKPQNRVCMDMGDVSTAAKRVECVVVGGPTEMTAYWAETKAERERIKNGLNGS